MSYEKTLICSRYNKAVGPEYLTHEQATLKAIGLDICPTITAHTTHGHNEPVIIEVLRPIGGVTVMPCRLWKHDGTGFKTLDDETLWDINPRLVSTLTARYYKGVSGHGDNLVMEVLEC